MALSEEQDREIEASGPPKSRPRGLSMRVQLIAALFVIMLLIYGFSRMHQAVAELAK